MFNGFFYEEDGSRVCQRFLRSSDDGKLLTTGSFVAIHGLLLLLSLPLLSALVIDPPFGGLATVLAQGVKKLWALAGRGVCCLCQLETFHLILRLVFAPPPPSELPTILAFPYFMEAHVLSALPSFVMLDYQVMCM